MTPLEAALRYAAVGWATFPVTGAKLPLPGSHGHHDATVDEQGLRASFARGGAGLAVACGSYSGLLVVDVDEKSGRSGSGTLREMGLELPPTVTALTRSGGTHHFYRWPVGARSRNDLFGGECGLDVKADGGYVVAWPTEGYRFLEKVRPPSALPDPPHWAVIRRREEVEAPFAGKEPGWGEINDMWNVLDATEQRLSEAPAGSRNDELNKLAFGVGRLVAWRYLPREEAIEALQRGALAAGLSEREIGWTIRSAFRGAKEVRDERR